MTRFVGTPLRGIEFANPSDEAVSARTTGDAHPRIRIDAGGRITWSSGSAAGDALLYRDAVGHLTTDTIFEASGGLITLTTNGAPTGSLPNGSIAIDTTNDVFYFRSNDEWLQVSSGANVTIQATEPLAAESGDLWFDSDTEILYILNGAEWVSVSGSLTLAELDDVSIPAPQAGDNLVYNGNAWVAEPGNNPKYAIAEVIGDGSETEFTINHNFGTRDVFVIARNNASPYEEIEIGWESTDVNNVDVIFSTPPAVDGVRINVLYVGATTINGTYTATIGDGTSLTYVVTHDFDTRDVNVVCREAASPYGVVDVAWEATTADTVTLYFADPPSSNEIRVVVYSSEILFSRVGARNLNELDDVTLSSPLSGDSLRYDGTAWSNSPVNLTELGDTNISAPIAGEVLKYDGTNWVNDPDSTGTSINALDDIGDVSVANAASGDFLKWNGSAWVNQSGVATESYVNTAVSNLVDSAPLALDTLNELAAALNDDASFSTTVTNALAGKAPLASPALTGVPTAPTATLGTDTTQIATTEFVQDAIGSFATNLDGLSDVVITSPEEFQVLEYNGTNWANKHASLVSYVRNAETTTLTTGTVVYLFGSTGDHATVKRADNNSDVTSSKTVGVVGASIAASQNGPVITRGYVDGINLSVGYAAGDVLWLGENGAFTKTKPTAPDHLVFVGVVVRATNNGIIYVATQNGYELDELHNVSLPSPASGEFLKYNGSLWVSSSIAINDLSDVDSSGASFNGALGTILYFNGTNWVPAVNEYGQSVRANGGNISASEPITGGTRSSALSSDGITVSSSGSSGTYSTAIGISGIEFYNSGNIVADFDSSKISFGTGANRVSIKPPTSISGATEVIIPNQNGTLALKGSIALGTDTTGNYVSDVSAGTGVSVSHTPGEGSTPTISIGQAVDTVANVQFFSVQTTGDITVGGNLTVNGTTTTLNTSTLQVEDNIITLNHGAISPINNAGIEVNRGGMMYFTPAIRWNEMSDRWEFTNDGTNYTEIGGSIMSSSTSAAIITMDIGA